VARTSESTGPQVRENLRPPGSWGSIRAWFTTEALLRHFADLRDGTTTACVPGGQGEVFEDT